MSQPTIPWTLCQPSDATLWLTGFARAKSAQSNWPFRQHRQSRQCPPKLNTILEQTQAHWYNQTAPLNCLKLDNRTND